MAETGSEDELTGKVNIHTNERRCMETTYAKDIMRPFERPSRIEEAGTARRSRSADLFERALEIAGRRNDCQRNGIKHPGLQHPRASSSSHTTGKV